MTLYCIANSFLYDTYFNDIKSREKYAVSGEAGFQLFILIFITSCKRYL